MTSPTGLPFVSPRDTMLAGTDGAMVNQWKEHPAVTRPHKLCYFSLTIPAYNELMLPEIHSD